MLSVTSSSLCSSLGTWQQGGMEEQGEETGPEGHRGKLIEPSEADAYPDKPPGHHLLSDKSTDFLPRWHRFSFLNH